MDNEISGFADDEILVLGGGVSGLSTAVLLAESGHRVRVWSRDPVERTTSAVAGAIWEPYRIEPMAKVLDWSARTFAVLSDLAADPEETGVRMVEGVQIAPELPEWAGVVPGVRTARPDELPDGFDAGFRARVPLADMPVYLRYLVRRLEAAGGRYEIREVASLEEAAGQVSRIVNCTGLGAHSLLSDPELRPVQGQLVIVKNPGIFEWFLADGDNASESLYVFPQPYGLILGGTAVDDVWNMTPDPERAAAIVKRCARFDARIATAPVIEQRVGLRPCRSEVRLVKEVLASGTVCVHNYGHGGAGITVSWACAAEAAQLVVSR